MMFVRYLVALPLILISYAGVPAAYRTLSAHQPRGDDFAVQFMKNLTSYDGFWPVPVAFLLFAGLWWMTAAWPRIALLPSAPIALMGVLSGRTDGWQQVALGLVTPAVAWGLAWLATRIVSRPITRDVRRSAVEVAIGLRGGGRLRVQSRRLLLDKLPPPRHPGSPVGRVAIRFDRIIHVEAGVVHTPAQWRFGNTSALTISPGPVLRVIGGGQEWLLPVDDVPATARLIVDRKKVRAKADPRPPLENARWTNAKTLWDLQDKPSMQLNEQKVRHGMHHTMLVLSVLTAAMAGYSVSSMFTDSWGFLIGVLFFGGISYGTARTWASMGAAQKLAEENPRSPMADDPDPRRIPVTDWSPQPVMLGQTSDL